MLLTYEQIETIIYDARYYPHKSYSDLVEQYLPKPQTRFPTINGSTQELIAEYPNHTILIEVEIIKSDDPVILYRYTNREGKEKYFKKFRTKNGFVLEEGVSKSDMHNEDYHGVTHIIQFPTAIAVWVREDA